MLIIGLCGSSGSGKSTVCRFFKDEGVPVFDCDKEYASLIVPPSACLDEIVRCFGEQTLLSNGSLNRKYLGALVFNSSEKRKELNSITFRHITKALRKTIDEYREKGEWALVIDAPLLFESGIDSLCDVRIGVIAPLGEKIARLKTRDNLSEELLINRISSQKSDDFLIEHCDYILNNNQTTNHLKKQTEQLLSILRSAP